MSLLGGYGVNYIYVGFGFWKLHPLDKHERKGWLFRKRKNGPGFKRVL